MPLDASVGAVGSTFSQEMGIRTELNPQAATFVNDVGGMLHPLPHESGLFEGFPVPKSRPSTSTPLRGITFPLPPKTSVLLGSVCNQPVIIVAHGDEVQSGLARVLIVADDDVVDDVGVEEPLETAVLEVLVVEATVLDVLVIEGLVLEDVEAVAPVA